MSKVTKPNPAFVAMFKEMINTLREAGWSQRRLCAELGYTESWLSKIKHAGQGMDLTVLIRICELTGIPPEKLLAGLEGLAIFPPVPETMFQSPVPEVGAFPARVAEVPMMSS